MNVASRLEAEEESRLEKGFQGWGVTAPLTTLSGMEESLLTEGWGGIKFTVHTLDFATTTTLCY